MTANECVFCDLTQLRAAEGEQGVPFPHLVTVFAENRERVQDLANCVAVMAVLLVGIPLMFFARKAPEAS